MRLRLADVHDSRCPADVICISAGAAMVSLAVALAGSPLESINLSLSLPGPPQQVAGVTLSLERLDPYPMASRPEQRPYVATVRLVPVGAN
jgi:hypothetical protein